MKYILTGQDGTSAVTLMGPSGVKMVRSEDAAFGPVMEELRRDVIDEDYIASLLDHSSIGMWHLTPRLVLERKGVMMDGEPLGSDVFDLVLHMLYNRQQDWLPLYFALRRDNVRPSRLMSGEDHLAPNGEIIRRVGGVGPSHHYEYQSRDYFRTEPIPTIVFLPCFMCEEDARRHHCED